MLKFLRNILLFSVPIALLFALPLFVFIKSGEAVPISEVIRLQSQPQPVFFGRAYSDVDQEFKIMSAAQRGADVMAIGSSRIMYIRSEFFDSGVIFYNLGGAAREITGLNFLKKLPSEKKPKIIIFGIDQRWFLPDYNSISSEQPENYDPAWREFFKYSWKKIYQDYFEGKFSLSDLFRDQTGTKFIGLNAFAKGAGFRNDGSVYSAGFINDSQKQKILKNATDKAIADIKPGQSNFDFGNGINNATVEAVDRFLNDCQANHRYIQL